MNSTTAVEIHPQTKKFIESFWRITWFPTAALDVSWIRIVVFGMFAYKLLSRDFSSLSDAPKFLLELYPTDIFSPAEDYLMLAYKPVVDLATFHWIHWVLPFPDASLLATIQRTVIGLCVLVVVFGRGPKNILAIMSYCGLTYLFGYLWRSGHDVDAIFVALQIALVYCFSRHDEVTLLRFPTKTHSRQAGWFMSMTILAFVNYYLLSGFNKLTDIDFTDWFRYGLVNEILFTYDTVLAGNYFTAPEFFGLLEGQNWIDYLGVPAVYLSHICIPMMYFMRHQISKFFFFYLMFHFMAWGVGILFFGLIITWFALVPISRVFNPLTVAVHENASFIPWLQKIQRLSPFAKLSVTPTQPQEGVLGYGEIIRASEADGDIHFGGAAAIRRILWASPPFWSFLLVLYIPGASLVVNWVLPARAFPIK